MDTCNSRTQQRKGKTAMEPAQSNLVITPSPPLIGQKRSQTFVKDSSFMSQTSSSRKNQGREWGVFNFPDTLAISTPFDVLMLFIGSRQRWALIWGSIRIENSDIDKAFLWLTTPKTIHHNIQTNTILSIRSSERAVPALRVGKVGSCLGPRG